MYESEARQLKVACPFYPEGAFIAGGALTSVFTAKPINDVDVYFKSRRAFEEAVAQAYDEGIWCIDVSKRAVTFAQGNQVMQMMHFDFFPTAYDIFAAFDFTAVMGAYDFDSGEFTLHPDFMKHNAQRFLRFNPGTRYPLASATRVLKYQARDYTIGKGDILKIALACRGVKIDTWDELKDQIGGAYGTRVKLAGEEKEFSLAAAIESLTIADDGSDEFIVPANDNGPGCALDLHRRIAALTGAPFDASRFEDGEDGDGWPVAA